MKLIALAVLLAIMQSGPPVPRQPTDHSASAGTKTQSQAKSEKAPAQKSTPSVNPGQSSTLATSEDQTQRHDSAGNGQGNDNAEHSASISKLPAVTVATPKRDWADWGYWAFSLCLAVVGGLQVLLLCWTLRAVRHQSHEMTRQRVFIGRQLGTMNDQLGEMSKQTAFLEKYVGHTETTANAALDSAVTAKVSADALINAERAWILVEGVSPPKELYSFDPHELQVMVFVYNFKVWGHTPTQMVESAIRFHLVPARTPADGKRSEPDLPEVPDYRATVKSHEIPEMGMVLPPGKPVSARVMLESNRISLPDFQEIKNREKFLCTYGILKYRDAFDRSSIRETRFCYVYDIAVGLVLTDIDRKKIDPDAFRVGGPPGYNGVT